MNGWRFFLTDFCICIPIVLLMAGLAYGWRVILPQLEAREAELVQLRYRAVAESIREGEAKGVQEYARDGRKSLGRLSRGTWGVDVQGGSRLVWYDPPGPGSIQGLVISPLVPYDYRRPAWIYGSGVLLLVLALTNVGLRRFRRFARERDDFIAATLHDLATPIAGLDLVLDSDPVAAKVLVERLRRLLVNLRDFLRMGGQRAPAKLGSVDAVAACREAYALFQVDFADSVGGEIVFDRTEPLMIRADEMRLVQTFWNLLGNELKYAAPYGKVVVRFGKVDGQARICIMDEGPGMTARQRRHAFDRYYRSHSARRSGKGGFGIGLCTAREFVRSMGGELAVDANSPQGCIFTLSFALG